MKKILFVIMTLIPAVVNAQLQNAGLENWTQDTNGHYHLNGWEHYAGTQTNWPNDYFFGTWRTDTASAGLHALKLSRWYNYTCDFVRQIAAVTNRPYGISGYYTYTDNELINNNFDSALVEIILTKWDSVAGQPDTIGMGVQLLAGASAFTLFNCPVQYTSTDVPDTAIVHIRPMPWSSMHINQTGWGSYLTVDDLSFEERTTWVMQPEVATINIYPNPVKDRLYISNQEKVTAVITDMTGRTIKEMELSKGNSTIDVSALVPGLYILTTEKAGTLKFIKE